MLIIVLVLLDKFEIKERIVIDLLINCQLCLFAITTVFPYKSAILQFIKHLTQCTVTRLVDCSYNLFASHANLFPTKSSYETSIYFKQRGIEQVKLICQFAVLGKENLIDILGKTKSFFKQVPIKRYAT